MNQNKLTKKQERFVEFYLQCWNGSEAARQAGYKNRPDAAAAQLMGVNGIKQAIKERAEQLRMTTDEIIKKLEDQARCDVSEFFEPVENSVEIIDDEDEGEEGNANTYQAFKISEKKFKEKGHLIKKVKLNREGFLESFEMYDSQVAIDKLARIKGMYVEKVALTDSDGKDVDFGFDEIRRRLLATIGQEKSE